MVAPADGLARDAAAGGVGSAPRACELNEEILAGLLRLSEEGWQSLRHRLIVGSGRAVGGTRPGRVSRDQYQNIVWITHHWNGYAGFVHVEPPRPHVGVSCLRAMTETQLVVPLHPLQRHPGMLVQVGLDLILAPALITQCMGNQRTNDHRSVAA